MSSIQLSLLSVSKLITMGDLLSLEIVEGSPFEGIGQINFFIG
jgi:hypothetical protein